LREEDTGVAQFFSPQRVLTAKAFQENKEEEEEEDKRQRAQRKEEAAYKRQEMEVAKQERAIQRQLRQVANKEEKEAEKTRKALEREKKRAQKEQDKQVKAALALERKKEREKRKKLAVAAQTVIASKAQTQRASTGPLTTRNARRISTTKAVKPPKGSQRRVRRSFGPSSSSPSNAADAVAAGAQNRSQRGRMVALPLRFRE
jgi:hypothetical protein